MFYSDRHPFVRQSLSLCLAICLLLSSSAAFAAGFAKFDGIKGESTDKDHGKWVDITSFEQGASIPTSSVSTGRARAAAQFADIKIKKGLDAASPKLAEALARGTVIKSVKLHLTSTTASSRATYYQVELKNVRISSYQLGGAVNGIPIEELTLNFEEIKVTYTKIDSRGKKSGSISYSWNVRTAS
jgi:type VI secretion system secreted protein Hcp